MQTNNRLFDDLARLASGAANALTGVRTEAEGLIRQQLEQILAPLQLVSREEFDVVRLMAVKAREENEALAARIAVLEAALKGDAPADAVAPAGEEPAAAEEADATAEDVSPAA